MSLDPVTAVADVLGDGLKLVAQKDAQVNTPAMVAARQADAVQALKEQIIAAIEKGDLDEIRRLCA